MRLFSNDQKLFFMIKLDIFATKETISIWNKLFLIMKIIFFATILQKYLIWP